MGFRLKTSLETKEIFDELGNRIKLKPFALSKIAIALSLNNSNSIDKYDTDNNGLELNRQTITAEYDTVYKVLIEQHCNKHLTDDEYFPEYIKKHIDRGAIMLLKKFDYALNKEKFISQIIKGDNTI